jgi:hypothetical protein
MIQLVTVASVIASERGGVRPPPVIDVNDSSQRDYWANRLHISHEDLLAAIDKVGPSLAAVLRHLRK